MLVPKASFEIRINTAKILFSQSILITKKADADNTALASLSAENVNLLGTIHDKYLQRFFGGDHFITQNHNHTDDEKVCWSCYNVNYNGWI